MIRVRLDRLHSFVFDLLLLLISEDIKGAAQPNSSLSASVEALFVHVD